MREVTAKGSAEISSREHLAMKLLGGLLWEVKSLSAGALLPVPPPKLSKCHSSWQSNRG